MIERNLVHVCAFLASLEAVDETSALVARLEARHDTTCEEATSTSGLKKKGGATSSLLHRSTMSASRRP